MVASLIFFVGCAVAVVSAFIGTHLGNIVVKMCEINSVTGFCLGVLTFLSCVGLGILFLIKMIERADAYEKKFP